MARKWWVAGLGGLVVAGLGVSLQASADDVAAAAAKNPRRYVRVPAPDGIQIRRYNKTDGDSPGSKDRVVVHYEGKLKDGTVFDSSMRTGRPAVFTMKKVVPCWQVALKLLHTGEKAQLTCPPDTAYGPKGAPPNIPPNATLTFEIELIGIH
jgi:FKBP-type peptidyl-prolyl cis-trans isomerase FkpA